MSRRHQKHQLLKLVREALPQEGFECRAVDDRIIEVVIPSCLHPDDDLVEVFVEETDKGRVRVSDMGETLRHMETMGIDVFASSERLLLVEQVVSMTHIALHGGKLEKEVPEAEVGAALLNVAKGSAFIGELLIPQSRPTEP